MPHDSLPDTEPDLHALWERLAPQAEAAMMARHQQRRAARRRQLGGLALAIGLFAGGYGTGRLTSEPPILDAAIPQQIDVSPTLQIQEAGTELVRAVQAAYASPSRQGADRGAAFAAVYGVAAELTQASPSDSLAVEVLQLAAETRPQITPLPESDGHPSFTNVVRF